MLCLKIHRLLECIAGRCKGMNEIKNILSTGREFIAFILPHGAPASLRPLVNELIGGFRGATWRTEKLVAEMNRLVTKYSLGEYNRTTLRRDIEDETCE